MKAQLWLIDPTRNKDGSKKKKLGRPRKARAGSPHLRRRPLSKRQSAHVVLRVANAVGSLRRRDLYRAVRRATLTAARRDDFRVVHISIQRTHIHLIVEAKDEKALARGMQGFQISAAKHINAALPKIDGRRRRGTVFPDRYHAEIIEHPYQARRALAYVLNNWRKHGEHRDPVVRGWRVDLFSSGVAFDGWIDGPPRASWPPEYEPLVVSPAETWMLRVGWRQFGLIDKRELPSAQEKRTRIERAVRAQVRMLADLAPAG